jgi:hypothetical protein
MLIFRFFAVVVFLAAFLAGAVLPAQAAEATTSTRVAANTRPPEPGPLKPGRTAGVQKAQQARAGLALIGAGAIIAVVVVAAGSSSGGASNNQPNVQFAPTTTTP